MDKDAASLSKTAAQSCSPVAKSEANLLGKVIPPPGLKPGTTTFGNEMHARIAEMLQKKYPDVAFEVRVRPGQTGVDITVVRGNPGFKYAEIKPRNAAQQWNFNMQVKKWGFQPGEVKPFTYDANGSIFDAF